MLDRTKLKAKRIVHMKLEGYSWAAIGEELGIAPGTVWQIVRRLRKFGALFVVREDGVLFWVSSRVCDAVGLSEREALGAGARVVTFSQGGARYYVGRPVWVRRGALRQHC